MYGEDMLSDQTGLYAKPFAADLAIANQQPVVHRWFIPRSSREWSSPTSTKNWGALLLTTV